METPFFETTWVPIDVKSNRITVLQYDYWQLWGATLLLSPTVVVFKYVSKFSPRKFLGEDVHPFWRTSFPKGVGGFNHQQTSSCYCLPGCDIGGAKELRVIYFPTNWGAKEPQNLPNHTVDCNLYAKIICCQVFLTQLEALGFELTRRRHNFCWTTGLGMRICQCCGKSHIKHFCMFTPKIGEMIPNLTIKFFFDGLVQPQPPTTLCYKVFIISQLPVFLAAYLGQNLTPNLVCANDQMGGNHQHTNDLLKAS